jgi:hypothetical protein
MLISAGMLSLPFSELLLKILTVHQAFFGAGVHRVVKSFLIPKDKNGCPMCSSE